MRAWYRRLTAARQETIAGYLFILPWLVGLLVFQAGSMVAALGLSFAHADLLTPPRLAGFANYAALWQDPAFWKALSNTVGYTVARTPLAIALGLMIALLVDRERPGIRTVRTLYFLPSVTAGVAVALLWTWIFSADFGLINGMLALAGIRGPNWLFSEELAMPALVMISLWTVGGSMLVHLAGLRGVPSDLLEAASIEGAGGFRRFVDVTLPLITPTLFYSLVTGVIVSHQIFLNAYVMTGGGPNNATLTIVLYLYRRAFHQLDMGYASALAWVLFVVILAATLLLFATARRWVYYEGGRV